MIEFALALKKLRDDKGISQYQLAHDLNIAQSTVGMWESGKRDPSIELLLRLTEYFDVPMGVLLGCISDTQIKDMLQERPELQGLTDEIRKLNREQTVKAIDYIQLLLLQQEQEQKDDGRG